MSVFSISADIIPVLSAGLGIFWFFGSKRPLYFQILTLATVCYTTVSLFRSVYYFCYGSFYQGPGITFLGYFGCFMFLFSANFGQYDSLIDDRTDSFVFYRLISLIAPAVLLGAAVIYGVTAKNLVPARTLVLTLIGFAPAVPASYYNFKHLILPDMGYSFSKGVRFCNLFALLIEVFETVRLFTSVMGYQTAQNICLLCIALSFFGLILFAKRGHKLWFL